MSKSVKTKSSKGTKEKEKNRNKRTSDKISGILN